MARSFPIAAASILLASVAVWFLRRRLSGLDDPDVAPWGGQVIFGYYLALLILAVRSLRGRLRSTLAAAPDQAMLLLIVIGLAADIVLNNIHEAGEKLDAAYGPMVLWDSVAFFMGLRALDLCESRVTREFRTSVVVATLPLWFLGREILLLPYAGKKPYFDLLLGDLAVCAWCVLAWSKSRLTSRRNIVEKPLAFIASFGWAYWIFSACEEVAYLLYRPANPAVEGALRRAHMPGYFTNVGFAVLAVITVALVRTYNPKNLAYRLALKGHA